MFRCCGRGLESVSPTAALGTEAQATTLAPTRSRSSVLGLGQPLLRRLARCPACRSARNSFALTSQGVEGLLALAVPGTIIDHGTREIMHARVTAHPTAQWLAQQMTEACSPDRVPPRYLIHDRDGCFGIVFNRRVRSLDAQQIRTPTPCRYPGASPLSAKKWTFTEVT